MHPVLFQIKSVTIYSYGFFVALAVLAVFFLAGLRARAFGFPKASMLDLVFLLFVSGVLGARLFFVIQHWEDYQGDFWKAFWIQEGGLVWYGGFFAAAFAGMAFCFFKKWPILKVCDFFAPLVSLAHAIGRVGCFFNGCCFGHSGHPVQLYEAVFLAALSSALFFFSSKNKKQGLLFVSYLFFYSVFRFGIEFLRGDQVRAGVLTVPQWTSLFLFLASLFLLFLTRKKHA
jgi:phosphatidylglycerol:prolipoprotein diacylglycerol transferase